MRVRLLRSTYTHSGRKIYRRLIQLSEIIEYLERYLELKPLGIVELPLEEACGMVLAEDIRAPNDYPPFDRALYDGYAVISDDVCTAREDRPVTLKVKGFIKAGDVVKVEIKSGECYEVATGALIPYPADTIIPYEYTSEMNGSIQIFKPFRKGFGIQYAASDIAKGEVIFRKGTLIDSKVLSILASVGVCRVKVYRKPIVGIIAVGNELVSVHERLSLGKIFESNSFMVRGFLRELNVPYRYYGIMPDIFDKVKSAVDKALEECDIVVTIGGTSAGREDIVFKVFETYEPGVIVHGVKIKPGSPLVIALSHKKLLIGLPGFPLSCYYTLHLIVKPILLKLMGLELRESHLQAILLKDVEGVPGYRRILPVLAKDVQGRILVYPIHVHSGHLRVSAYCDGFIVVPEDVELLKRGSKVEYYPTSNVRYDITFIGSHCPLLEDFLHTLKGLNVRIIFSGSMGGIEAIRHSIADMAGIHLYKPKEGYNTWVIKELKLKNVVLVRGYLREQGLIYNPKLDIKDFSDILTRNLRFVNRNKGSGTRVLIELLLEETCRKLNITVDEAKKKIRGFNLEVSTHEAVALAIKNDKADVGVGIRYVAEKYGLAFRSLNFEVYDIVVKKDFTRREVFRRLILEFKKFLQERVASYPGYKLLDESGEIIYEA